ncbi:MAG TPA: HAD hydrolase-like protein [Bacteriovoracaceae bacterium]|nr:HAD hydrolase-like protein [Bacteriovoracaceae bacterium]
MNHIIFDCDGTLIDTASPKYRLFPGIKELLLELSKDNKIYVWTVRGRASTLRLLQDSGVLGFFESISTVDDAIPKPHIAGLFDLVGVNTKDSICVIGDSSNDMIGATNFGVLAIGATWSSGVDPEALLKSGAHFIAATPSECSVIIRSHLKQH